MLNLNEYTNQIEDIEIGQTIRLNHDDCEAGQDTRRRLYLTRPEARPDSVVAFCHNCQQSGFKTTGSYEAYRKEVHGTAKERTILDVVARPDTLESTLNHWPSDAQAWAIKNKLTQQLIHRYGIAFDTSTHRVYLPRYSTIVGYVTDDRSLVGYQLRKVRTDNGPKYLTVSSEEDKGYTLIDHGQECTVIVEDYISGLHIAEASTDVNVLVNWGVKVNLEALYAVKDAGYLLVWLDNDGQHILNQAKVMARTWRLISGNNEVNIIDELTDPKHYYAEEIDDVIRGVV